MQYEIGDKRPYYGYVQIKTKDGWKYEHRDLIEQHLGRKLKPGELVHHINENKTDNRLENLQLMTLSKHVRHHMTGKNISDATKAKMSAAKKGKNLSDEHKAKLKESWKKRRK